MSDFGVKDVLIEWKDFTFSFYNLENCAVKKVSEQVSEWVSEF